MDVRETKAAVHFVQASFSGGQPLPGVEEAPRAILAAAQAAGYSFSVSGLDTAAISLIEQDYPRETVGTIHNLRLATEVNRRLREDIIGLQGNGKILVVGGDHSVAIGSISGMCAREPGLKVVWVDAHADINPLGHTLSGNLHGCPVAFLMGVEDSRMEGLQPCLRPTDIVYIGLRDIEPQEKLVLDSLGIAKYTMEDVHRLGMERVIREIGEFVGESKVHVSLDVDGLDPEFTGATGTPVPGGLSVEDTQSLLRSLQTKQWISMDLVEVNLLLSSPQAQAHTLRHSLELLGTFLTS